MNQKRNRKTKVLWPNDWIALIFNSKTDKNDARVPNGL